MLHLLENPSPLTLPGVSVSPPNGSSVPGRKPVSGVDVAARIRAAMERAGVDTTELAQRCGVRWQTAQYWEIGRSTPSAGSLRRIAKALGMTLDELLGVAAGQDPPFEGWRAFLQTPQGQTVTAEERKQLQSMYWPTGVEPGPDTYLFLLSAIRTARAE